MRSLAHTILRVGILAACGWNFLLSASQGARPPSPDDPVVALRSGGMVLVMRHASSPREAPTRETAADENVGLERQLDEHGRRGAEAMGVAIRELGIPVGDVLTSPTFRARETLTHARLGLPVPLEELGDGGQSMTGVTDAQAAWLRSHVTRRPSAGNTVIVTHEPNLRRAFPDWLPLAEGETVIVRPDGLGAITIVGRLKIEDWPALQRSRR